MSQQLVHVVAAVILNEQGAFLLSSRPEGKHYAGYWEFADGKVETGESELAALQRELQEELGIDIQAATPWLIKIHHYEHASVLLRFFRVLPHQWQGQVVCREAQQYSWQQAGRFDVQPMLPANGSILRALGLPIVLTGSHAQGWHGSNGMGGVHMGFGLQDAVRLLPAGAIPNVSQGLQLQAWLEMQTLDGCEGDGWWRSVSASQADAVLAQLQQGCAVPIVALVAAQDTATAARLQAAGVHVALTSDMEVCAA